MKIKPKTLLWGSLAAVAAYFILKKLKGPHPTSNISAPKAPVYNDYSPYSNITY